MKYALLVACLCLSACGGVKVATGVSPVADIANAGGKIEDTGQAIFQVTLKAQAAKTPGATQGIVNDVTLAVNKLGHGGLALNAALGAYNQAKAAGKDVTAQKAAVQSALKVVDAFLESINEALPTGWLQSIDLLVNEIIDAVTQIKLEVGL